ncbi:uncharacterized protein [Argopecten irradians]|uniref:uncharacterized protein n=1 Tax=Argopecten irradians TaxID=31199 RepID=UPI003722DCF2
MLSDFVLRLQIPLVWFCSLSLVTTFIISAVAMQYKHQDPNRDISIHLFHCMMYWLFIILVFGSVARVRATTEESPVGRVEVSETRTEDRMKSDEGSLRSLVESLLERIERQDARLQQMEKTIQNNVDDLKHKDVRINNLERELDQMRMSLLMQPSEGNHQHYYEISDPDVKSNLPQEKGNSTESMIPSKKMEDQHRRPERVPPASPEGENGAFSVSLSKNLDLHADLVLKYDQVNLDRGGNYNKADGVYTVPVGGLYVFTWTTTSTSEVDVFTELVVDGTSWGRILTDGDNYHWDATTAIVVVPVNAGDHVFVRSTEVGHMYSDTRHGGPSFSGWRLA